jgi:hypothetical protein
MTSVVANDEVREYLEAVRARLGDLHPEEREHLLSDTEASLLEAAGDEAGIPLEVRLGPPERFAGELRAAAGLPEPPAAASRPGLLARLAAHPSVSAARALARDLVPAWWVARGFVAFTVVAQALGDDWSIRYPIFTRALRGPLGWVLLAAVVWASVALGRRERAAPRRRTVALNVALGLAALWMVIAMSGNAGAARQEVIYAETATPQGLAFHGQEISNVYAYDRRGRLLQDVRLFDELGRPLAIRPGEGRPRRVVADRSGERLYNTFPIRYFERGTRRVRRPRAGALPEAPRPIVTPPVRTRRR